ncbi:MAG: hypothetical protein ABI700_10350 [Chloroflexota bacterium]
MSSCEKQPTPADQSIRFPVSAEVLATALQEGTPPKQVEPCFVPSQAESINRFVRRYPKPAEWSRDPSYTLPVPAPALSFEQAFKFYEPAFHTVFYRKYHSEILQDAKQVALLALFKKWCKDKTLLEQAPAFVVTAAIFGISNWRKKEQKRVGHEIPLLVDNHGWVAGLPKTPSPGRWTDKIDFRIDLDCALDTVFLKFSDHPDYKAIYNLTRDLVDDTPYLESWKKSGLSRGDFKRHREMVKAALARQLSDYRRNVVIFDGSANCVQERGKG